MGQYRDIIAAEAEELRKVSETFDEEALEKFHDVLIARGGKLFITACGTSAAAAKKAVHTLQVVERQAFFLEPSDAVHGGLGVVGDKDVVAFISKGGATGELLSFIPNVKEKGALIVSLGENPNSPIARQSDLFIKVKIDREPDVYNMLATASTVASIAVFDALAITLMRETHYSREEFLVNHPSGDVGERLASGRA